jgi:hypothetical protein
MLGFNFHWIYAHLIGDYIVQNDWMAGNKKNKGAYGTKACLIHVITYMIPFLFTSLTALQLILIGSQHYIQDRTFFVSWFCRITGKFQNDFNRFWGHVIVDNVFHIVFMMLIVKYV